MRLDPQLLRRGERGARTERLRARRRALGRSARDHRVHADPGGLLPGLPDVRGHAAAGRPAITLTGWVYRHEPSLEPTRLQAFRMREFIRVGTTDEVVEWRNTWLERGLELLKSLQLPVASDVANDPFFGRAGKIMAAASATSASSSRSFAR